VLQLVQVVLDLLEGSPESLGLERDAFTVVGHLLHILDFLLLCLRMSFCNLVKDLG